MNHYLRDFLTKDYVQDTVHGSNLWWTSHWMDFTCQSWYNSS